MGGRGISSATSKSGASTKSKGFSIDIEQTDQIIKSGMSQKDALVEAGKQLANAHYEVGVVIADDGTIYAHTDKELGRTSMPFSDAHSDGANMDNIITLHNHPTEDGRKIGGPFSDADGSIQYRKGITEQYAVAKEGLYKLRISDPSKADKAAAFFTTEGDRWYIKKTSNYMKNTKKAWESGGLSYQLSDDSILKSAHKTLQKFSKRYGFEYTFTPNEGYEHIYD